MTYRLGLTGSIATGKSAVSKIFKAYGCPIVDGDVVARQIVAPGSSGLANIVTHFGAAMLLPDGTLDRKKLGALVFADEAKRAQLNALNGPLIRQEILRQVAQWTQKKAPLVILDIPLLYETHYEVYTDGVMVVYIPRALEIKRLMKRDQISQTAALQRIDSQMSIEAKKKRADFVIDNTGDIQALQDQVSQFLQAHDFLPQQPKE